MLRIAGIVNTLLLTDVQHANQAIHLLMTFNAKRYKLARSKTAIFALTTTPTTAKFAVTTST